MSDQGALGEKRELAAKVLREVLERMGVDAEVSAFDDGERIILDAHGSESGLVIGKKGATLDALQYLVSRIVFKKPSEGATLIVDAEGYRARRASLLKVLAERTAQKVGRGGGSVTLQPMTASERKIIHLHLKDNPRVETASEGQEPRRAVVVSPRRG